MNKDHAVSIVVPTLNEAENIPTLLARIDRALNKRDITYEVIIVDDKSSDSTLAIADSLTSVYPLRTFTKRGKRGKAYSLLEGFEEAHYPLIAMIDADLQYPPEDLVPMHRLITKTNADLIVTNRIQKDVSKLRQLSTKIFNLVFARALFGIGYDTQSGLKLFKRRILSSFTMKPSPWSFDLEFIVRAIEHKYKIVSHDILFEERTFGETKVRLLSTTFELAKASLDLRFNTSYSRIRQGLRANNRFLEKAFPLVLATLFATGLALSIPKQTAALEIDISPAPLVTTTSASIMSEIRDFFTGDSRQEAPQPTTSKSQSNNESSSATTSKTTTPSPTAKTTTTNPTPATNKKSVSSISATAATTTSTPASSTTASAGNDATLSAATPTTKKTDVYDKSYPHYALSGKTTQTFNTFAQTAIIAGILCTVMIALLLGTRSVGILGGKIITRS